MKKSKWAILLPALFLAVSVSAQSKITDNTVTNTDNPAALLDLQSGQRGFLPPRVQLSSTTSWTPLAGSPVAGMTVFNPAAAGSGPTAVTTGYYYNNGTNWIRLLDAISGSWSLLGNAATVDGTNFIGTTDGVPLNFRVANNKAGRIEFNSTTANTAFGYSALSANSTGANDNTAFGYNTLSANISGSFNTGMGWQTLVSNTASYNTAYGVQGLKLTTTGNSNAAFGVNALFWNSTGIANTALGAFSGYTNDATATGGNYNTFVGAYSDITPGAGNLTNATAIGFDALVGQSNSMVLGGTVTNGYAVNVGIGNTAPSSTLQVSGSIATGTTNLSAATTLSGAYSSVFLAGATYTVTLPAASTCQGRIYKFMKTSTNANVVTINSAGGTINGAASKTLNIQYSGYTIQSDGTNWYIML